MRRHGWCIIGVLNVAQPEQLPCGREACLQVEKDGSLDGWICWVYFLGLLWMAGLEWYRSLIIIMFCKRLKGRRTDLEYWAVFVLSSFRFASYIKTAFGFSMFFM